MVGFSVYTCYIPYKKIKENIINVGMACQKVCKQGRDNASKQRSMYWQSSIPRSFSHYTVRQHPWEVLLNLLSSMQLLHKYLSFTMTSLQFTRVQGLGSWHGFSLIPMCLYECVYMQRREVWKRNEHLAWNFAFIHMRQKNQLCTVRLKENGALWYRKDKGAPQDWMDKRALQNCTSNCSLGSGSVIEIQH